MNLHEFLRNNPVDGVREEVYISKRFHDAKLPFTIRPMSGDEFAKYKTITNQIKRHGKTEFNHKLFSELVVLNHTVNPNFRDSTEIKAAGCETPEEYLYKSLGSGEIEKLVELISELSGFDADMDELRDEAKNS